MKAHDLQRRTRGRMYGITIVIGSTLVLLGLFAMRAEASIALFFGSMSLVLGAQTLLYVAGLRLELLGTSIADVDFDVPLEALPPAGGSDGTPQQIVEEHFHRLAETLMRLESDRWWASPVDLTSIVSRLSEMAEQSGPPAVLMLGVELERRAANFLVHEEDRSQLELILHGVEQFRWLRHLYVHHPYLFSAHDTYRFLDFGLRLLRFLPEGEATRAVPLP